MGCDYLERDFKSSLGFRAQGLRLGDFISRLRMRITRVTIIWVKGVTSLLTKSP